MAKAKVKWIAYIPDDGHWDIPGDWINKSEARLAFLKMLQLDRCPNGTYISRKEA